MNKLLCGTEQENIIQVIMPMAKPSIVTVILFNFLAFWEMEYIISMTLLTGIFKYTSVGLCAEKSAVQYGQMYAGLGYCYDSYIYFHICVQKKLTQGMTLED